MSFLYMCFDYLVIIHSLTTFSPYLFVQFLLTLLLQDNKTAFFLKNLFRFAIQTFL